MESYQITSIIGKIADGIENLIRRNIIKAETKVILYGLERYSFAMRTILSNLGFHNIEGYLSENEELIAQYQADIKNFSCRFLNDTMDLINIWKVEELLNSFDQNTLILIASQDHVQIKKKLETLGYQENIDFYIVYNFQDKELDDLLKDKIKMSLTEIQQTEKQILVYVDELCQKYNLRYWVCGGTLLGAIRHRGFIPWDDDIDIFLPLQDYERLIKVFEETEHFDMLGFGTAQGSDFSDPFAKVVDKRTLIVEDIGTVRKINPLFIDVFPLTGLPDKEAERRYFFAGYKELNRRIWQKFYDTNGKIEVLGERFGEQMEYLSKYQFDQSNYVGVLGTAYGEKDCTTRQVYHSTLRLPFEDIKVNVPVGYKEYLDHLYGKDWMQIPERDKQKTHHMVTAYWNR